MTKRTAALPIVLLTAFIAAAAAGPALGEETLISREQLLEDARQLATVIEATHPDPYLVGGGKLAFHRRLGELLAAIPPAGASDRGFCELARPFVASLGDSHTGLQCPGAAAGHGLPLGFKVVEQDLIVVRVPDARLKSLLGARLLAIEGVEARDLVRRQRELRGTESDYTALALLVARSLNSAGELMALVPRWDGGSEIQATLLLPDGQRHTERFAPGPVPADEATAPPTTVPIPSREHSDVAFGFLDAQRQVGILVVANLMRYREASESWFAEGLTQAEEATREAWTHFHEGEPPADRAALLAGIPSATESLVAMVDAMAAAGTRHLIVDLRDNTGGNSILREILAYFLFGQDGLRRLDNGYSVRRVSQLLLEQHSGVTLETLNRERPLPLQIGDYDFLEEARYRAGGADDREPRYQELDRLPTFRAVYQTGSHHRPKVRLQSISVLSTPLTYSSGFNVLTGLVSLGASVVGTPSGQAGNNFGDVLQFRLHHSGVPAFVSHKWIVTFPGDPERGRCLMPDVPLTYASFARHGFDPNTEVLLALERIGGTKPR